MRSVSLCDSIKYPSMVIIFSYAELKRSGALPTDADEERVIDLGIAIWEILAAYYKNLVCIFCRIKEEVAVIIWNALWVCENVWVSRVNLHVYD